MTIYLPEVRKVSMDYVNLPVFNPNVFSEDEDDLPGVLTRDTSLSGALPQWVVAGQRGCCLTTSLGASRVESESGPLLGGRVRP